MIRSLRLNIAKIFFFFVSSQQAAWSAIRAPSKKTSASYGDLGPRHFVAGIELSFGLLPFLFFDPLCPRLWDALEFTFPFRKSIPPPPKSL